MLAIAQREGLVLTDIYRESHSAKQCGQRPVYNQLLDDIRLGKFNGIMVWHPDRLSRNAGDLGAIVDLFDQQLLIEIRTYSQRFTNNPNEKFLLMILGSQAKLENDNKSINVKRGLKTRAEMGLMPGVAPPGYLNDKRSDHKCEMFPDPVRAPIIKEMFERVGNDRWSGRKVYAWLREIKFKSKNNKDLCLSTIYDVLKNPFYCGVYEYPRGSGNWYTGKHQALISKELFQRAQSKLGEERRAKVKFKEFTFVRLMTCGLCGSGITAQEKSKTLSDGSVNWYIYYGCTRAKDRDCKNTYLREDQLIEQLCEMIDQIDLDEIGARHLIEKEVSRFNKLQGTMKKKSEKLKADEMDIRRYAKYLLTEGSVEEKRALLENLKNRITLINKKISLAS
jgi:DNA invertase Pin-like site-specific DNA recombinase